MWTSDRVDSQRLTRTYRRPGRVLPGAGEMISCGITKRHPLHTFHADASSQYLHFSTGHLNRLRATLPAAILRQRQHLDPDPVLWKILVETETETEVRREHGRLDEFSDESEPALKELKRKIEAIERALKYLSDSGLEPGVPSRRDELELRAVVASLSGVPLRPPRMREIHLRGLASQTRSTSRFPDNPVSP